MIELQEILQPNKAYQLKPYQLKMMNEIMPWSAASSEETNNNHAADKTKPQQQVHGANDAKLMILSDDPINAEVMRDYLTTFGYHHIILTHDISKAFDTIFQESPDAVLYENSHLTPQAFHMLEQIRNNKKTRLVPLLILTAEADQDTKLKALELGVVDIIIKPASANELYLRLRNILTIKTYHDQIAHFDGLTKLPNRESFLHHVDRSLKYAARYKTIGAILQIGLNRFKHINEVYGISIADQLLRIVAERVKVGLNHTDIISRLDELDINTTISRAGDDEFLLLLPIIPKADDAAIVSLRLHEEIVKPYVIEGQEIYITANIGIAIFPDDGNNKDMILHSSSVALNQARKSHNTNHLFFSKELNTLSAYRLTMENNLRKALELNQFEMYYQPKISLASKQVIGAEALIRWRHPEYGFISPEEFIPIAEESDNILALGSWIIKTVTQQISSWKANKLVVPRIALNISSHQLKSARLLTEIKTALKHANIDASYLTIELTETAVMDNIQEIVSMLNQLKSLGAKISIDDFGTGYSSLMQLKQLPLDELKIDRTFTMDIGRDKNSEAIILATLAMAQNLGFNVVAEGVETKAQFNFLHKHGCNEYQGYLFSSAISAEEFGVLIG